MLIATGRKNVQRSSVVGKHFGIKAPQPHARKGPILNQLQALASEPLAAIPQGVAYDRTPARGWFAFGISWVSSDLSLPALEDGQPARDPFDSQLVSSIRRTPDGFEFRLHTR